MDVKPSQRTWLLVEEQGRSNLLRITNLTKLSVLGIVFALFGCSESEAPPPPDAALSATGVDQCAACHGSSMEGDEQLKAPALANLDAWYLKSQLTKFRDGVRGGSEDDSYAQQMAAIVVSLTDDAIDQLAGQVADYDDIAPAASPNSEAEAGHDFYQHQCGACHGPGAKGNEALQAPRLAGLSDWYIEAQLEKFRSGMRGGHPDDVQGAQMVFMMSKLGDGEEMEAIRAYLQNPQIAP